MSQNKPHLPPPVPNGYVRAGSHPTGLEQNLALAVVLWLMLAGVCVVIANAWAMEMMG